METPIKILFVSENKEEQYFLEDELELQNLNFISLYSKDIEYCIKNINNYNPDIIICISTKNDFDKHFVQEILINYPTILLLDDKSENAFNVSRLLYLGFFYVLERKYIESLKDIIFSALEKKMASNMQDKDVFKSRIPALIPNYKKYFEFTPIPLWILNLSKQKKLIDDLKSAGVNKFRFYFYNHPDILSKLIDLIEFEDLNQAALKLTKADSKSRFLKENRKFFIKETEFAVKEQILEFIEGKKEFEIETLVKNFSGDLLTVKFVWYILPDSENNWKKIILLGEDVTDLKRSENFLKEAKEAAEKSNKSKSSFLANMSHELRTPLNAILGYAKILQTSQGLSDFQKNGVDVIERSGKHLLNMINDILDLSRIEADKMELRENDFCLPEFLKNIAEVMRIRAESKDLEFIFQMEDNLPYFVRADEQKMNQILLNLLSNAVKYTESGNVNFKILRVQNKVRFHIQDTGIGIPENKLDSLFKPFSQINSNGVRNEGTGLGLAITKNLIEQMGGSIQVKSSTEKGTVFTVDILLKEIEKITKQKKINFIGYKGEKIKILAVDSNINNLNYLGDILIPLGFEYYSAADGEKALTEALKILPDLLIINLNIEGLSGMEIIKRLRIMTKTQNINIICIAKEEGSLIKSECRRLGCSCISMRKRNKETILKKIKQVMNLEWIYSEIKSPPAQEPKLQDEDYPPLETLRDLLSIAEKGDIINFRNEVLNLHEEGIYEKFTEYILDLTDNFKLNKIKKILEKTKVV